LEDFFDFEKVKATVFLLSEGDQKNIAMVSDEHLMLVRKGKKNLYPLSKILSVNAEVKKSLLPLFVGGIFTPFALLSYFSNIFHPMVHLVATLLGLLLFYIGWLGRSALIIRLSGNIEELVFLPGISNNLRAFIDYLAGLIKAQKLNALSGMVFFDRDKKGLFSMESNAENTYPIFGFTYMQIQKWQKTRGSLIAVDPVKAGREVKILFDPQTNEMRPAIDGPIDSKAEVKFSDAAFSKG
jgi:hypothetical protein